MDPSEVASLKLRDVEVLGVSTIADRAVFRALWKAHRARAKADGDIGLLVTADVLLDAANRVPSGALPPSRWTTCGGSTVTGRYGGVTPTLTSSSPACSPTGSGLAVQAMGICAASAASSGIGRPAELAADLCPTSYGHLAKCVCAQSF